MTSRAHAASVPSLFGPSGPAPARGAIAATREDAARRANNLLAVLALMGDGIERDLAALRAVGGSSGDRRFRELREPEFGGFVIARRRDASGDYRYRIDVTQLTDDQRARIRHARQAVR